MPPASRPHNPSPGRPLPVLSPYQAHVKRWENCTACHLHDRRQRTVFSRGDLPCDLLFIGEGPGACISGETLIDTAYRDKSKYPKGIPVKNLVGKTGVKVYSYDTKYGTLAIGNVKRTWRTGVKVVYRVSYFWWGAPGGGKGGRKKYYDSIKVTSNHPFLLKNGDYQSIDQGLKKGSRLQPFYRHGTERFRVGVHSARMETEAVFLLQDKIGREIVGDEQAHHEDRNPHNDEYENLTLLGLADHARVHGLEDNPMFVEEHRATHKQAVNEPEYRLNLSQKMSAHLATPEGRAKRLAQIYSQRDQTSATLKQKYATDPVFYYQYLKNRRFRNGNTYSQEELEAKMADRFPNEPFPPSDTNHVIYSIEKVGLENVYDMEVEEYHNFATQGIFVHNSEDLIGRPFVGPAGKLQDYCVRSALARLDNPPVRIAYTNLLLCIPLDENGEKEKQPPDECVEACAPRLQEFIRIANPRLVIAVGKDPKVWLDQGLKHSIKLHKRCQVCGLPQTATVCGVCCSAGHDCNGDEIPVRHIVHPSAILQAPGEAQELMIKRNVFAIVEVIRGVLL